MFCRGLIEIPNNYASKDQLFRIEIYRNESFAQQASGKTARNSYFGALRPGIMPFGTFLFGEIYAFW